MPTATTPRQSASPASTEPTQEPETLAAGLRASPGVRKAIDAIVSEVRAAQKGMTGIRGPRDEQAAARYEDLLREAGELRGRALVYPHIGSGLGNGPYVELADGSVKLDMICGIGVQFFGHSDADLIATALLASTSDTVMQGHLMCNTDTYDFSRTLLAEAKKGSRLAHVFAANAGVMANENALKMAFQRHAPASRVIAFADCFMGRTVTMSQIGDSATNRDGIPLSTLVDYVPFFDADLAKASGGDTSGATRAIDASVSRLREHITRYPKQHACFVFELVQGEGGFNTAPPEFFRELMTICKEANIAVWDDEVQTFGRTTEMFAYDALGLGQFIDLCTVGKMTQTCATLFTPEYNPRAGLLSATFLGTAQSHQVGERILQRLRDGGHYGPKGKHARHAEAFLTHARALIAKRPEWFPTMGRTEDLAHAVGGMVRFTPFGGKKDAVMKLCRALFDEGLITFYCGHDPYHVRMLPPLGVMEESVWATAFEVIERAMGRVAPGNG